MPAVNDPTQRQEGDASEWAREPLEERHALLKAHTDRPYNAEPPNSALTHLITPLKLHYRRQHTPVPLLSDKEVRENYRLEISYEDKPGSKKLFSLNDLQKNYGEQLRDVPVTLMCTGNRRSEFNTKTEGETMGLPWKNGSISTAKWSGCLLSEVLKKGCGITPETTTSVGPNDKGYYFITLKGLEDYHVSVPLDKVWCRTGDCMLVWKMNGTPLPRDHGFPLRVIIPGYVGARSVKWIKSITITREETDGMHQRGIAYKQLAPNIKALSAVTKDYIEHLPPIDHVPVTSAITYPEPGANVVPGEMVELKGYAYSGAGLAVIRVDISVDGGGSWVQADFERADSSTQGIRSGRAWAWVQWRKTIEIPKNSPPEFTIYCKAIDDQYNQQPHDPKAIWNLRGILNTSWGQVKVKTGSSNERLHKDAAASGDGSILNVGMHMGMDTFQCPFCKQRFGSQGALDIHVRCFHNDRLMEYKQN